MSHEAGTSHTLRAGLRYLIGFVLLCRRDENLSSDPEAAVGGCVGVISPVLLCRIECSGVLLFREVVIIDIES